MGRSEDRSQSCCTWIKVASVFLVLVVAGILIWQFAPVDRAIDNLLPKINNTISGSGNDDVVPPDGSGSTPAPDPSVPAFEFMKCADPSSNCCNGLDNGFCDLRVDQVMFATSHNANADAESGFFISPNHRFRLEDSLKAGYRGINIDVCNCGGELTLCHGTCGFGTRDVVEVLFGINEFLNENPSEIVILPMELNSEVDQEVDLGTLYGLMQEVPGFTQKLYEHQNVTGPWPTLGQLVETNKRIIAFHFRGPSCDSQDSCPPGLHWYHRYAINTQFDLPNLNAVADSANSCTFTRTPGIASKTFFGLNNFLTIPSQSSGRIMNQYDFIADRIDTCSSVNDGLEVSFVYVDFWNEGDLPRLVQDRNTALSLPRKLEQAF